MQKNNDRPCPCDDEQAIWATLLSSIISLITASLLVLQRVCAKAGGKYSQVANVDFSKTINKLNELCNPEECCVCRNKYALEGRQQQQAPRVDMPADSYVQQPGGRGCTCGGAFPDNAFIEPEQNRQVINPDDYNEVQFTTVPELTTEVPPVPPVHRESQTPSVEQEHTGTQRSKINLVDRDMETDRLAVRSEATLTEEVDTRHQAIQNQPDCLTCCSQQSAANMLEAGTQKTLQFEDQVETCDPYCPPCLAQAPYYQPQGDSSEFLYDDDQGDDYEEEDDYQYQTPPPPARPAYGPEVHCMRPVSTGTACPETCPNRSDEYRQQAMRRLVRQPSPTYGGKGMCCRRLKPQGPPPAQERVATKGHYSPVYGHQRKMYRQPPATKVLLPPVDDQKSSKVSSKSSPRKGSTCSCSCSCSSVSKRKSNPKVE